jgi:ankyrin repeat protein
VQAGYTALHHAAESGYMEISRLLLLNDAGIEIRAEVKSSTFLMD